MKHGAFVKFLLALNCLPATKRRRRINDDRIAFLSNWVSLVVARYFDVADEAERLELRRKMEAFLAPFVNTGFDK